MTVSVAVEVEDVATETVRALDDDLASTIPTDPSGSSSPLDAGSMATAADAGTTTDGADALADTSADTVTTPRL